MNNDNGFHFNFQELMKIRRFPSDTDTHLPPNNAILMRP